MNQGNYEEAIADFNHSIALAPDFTEAYCNRGGAKASQEDHGGAMADFDRAIALNPDYAAAYYNRGLSKVTQRNYSGAVEDWNRAIALNSEYPEAYLARGNAKASQGNYGEAITDYDHAIGLNPDFTLAYANRGLTKVQIADYDGATEDYDQAVTLGIGALLESVALRSFYDVKEQVGRAVERKRLQSEHGQMLEIANQKIIEHERRYVDATDERDRLADENYRLKAQVEQLTNALADKRQMTANAPRHSNAVQILYYSDSRGRTPYMDWLIELDRTTQRRVRDAISKMQSGNFSDSKPLHSAGLFERRMDFGLRIYYARPSAESVLILGGGDKPDQQSDIDVAAERLVDWRARHPK